MWILLSVILFFAVILSGWGIKTAETSREHDFFLFVLIIACIWFGGCITHLTW